MLFDFTTEQILRFHTIKRWNIIEMAREQTLPEHSYNVTMLSIMIYDKMHEIDSKKYQKNNLFYSNLMQYCLAHDLPELFTGDIPTPLKKSMAGVMENVENELFPKFSEYKDRMDKYPLIFTIAKIADYIDAIQFARKFCVDSRKDAIISEMEIKLSQILRKEDFTIKWAVEDVWTDARIFSKDTL